MLWRLYLVAEVFKISTFNEWKWQFRYHHQFVTSFSEKRFSHLGGLQVSSITKLLLILFLPSQPRLVFFADLQMLLQVRNSWLGCTGKDLLAMVTDTLVSILFGSGELLPHTRPWHNQLLHLLRLGWFSRCCICISTWLLVLLVFTLHLNISGLVIESWGCHLQERKKLY